MERQTYERIREIEKDHWWFVARREILDDALKSLKLPKPARILEVGCGTGGNLGLLARFGDVRALEPDAESRQFASETSGISIDDGGLPNDLPYAKESFDLVCAFDVVEHVDDDAAAVKALASLVSPGGALVCTVPAFQWMWSRHDEMHHHKRRYLKPEFQALFEGHGLTVERSAYFNALLFPVAAIVRHARKVFGVEGDDDRLPPPWLNKTLTNIFRLERLWMPRGAAPLGLSILVIARRKPRA